MSRSFNGTTDVINAGNITSLNSATKAVLSAWVYRSSTGTTAGCGTASTSNTNTFSFIWYSDGNIYCTASNAAGNSYGFCALAGTGYHHVAMAYDGSQSTDATRLLVYIDGVAKTLSFSASIPAALGPTTGNTFCVGKDNSTRFTGGSVAEVACWTGVTLTADEVKALARGCRVLDVRPSTRPGIYLPLYGLQSPEPDFSGNGLSGTLTGTARDNHAPVTSATKKARTPPDATSGASVSDGTGSATGSCTAVGVGAALAAAAGASTGAGTASAVGAALAASAGSSTGSATAAGVGAALAAAAGSATGIATAAAVGAALAETVGSSTGAGTAAGVGAVLTVSVGTAAGVATVSGAGAALADAVGLSTGSALVSGIGVSLAGAVGLAMGTGTATGSGAALADAAGSAAGTCTVIGISTAPEPAPINVLELVGCYDPIIFLRAQYDPVIELAGCYDPIIELRAQPMPASIQNVSIPGDNKILEFTVFQADGATPQNISGWAFILEVHNTAGDVFFSRTGNEWTIVSAVDGKVRCSITPADAALLTSRVPYYFNFRRAGTSLRDTLTYGRWTFLFT